MLNRFLMLLLIPCTCIFAQDPFSAIRSFIEELIEDDESEESVTAVPHVIQLPSGMLHYTAITGTIPQFKKEKLVGELFFTAYLKETEDEARPITFIFNGGPGGSSLAMHIGGFGPKRLLLPEEGQKRLPPYQMIDNPETLLVDSDLVFIDPMGTGYSRSDKDSYKQSCYSVEGDLSSFAEFIRVFCLHFDKWNSPKYLLGASYGTARACGLAERLIWNGIHLNGVILLGCAIDFATLADGRDQALSDCLLIPSFAATAWYHGRTMQDKTLEEVVEYARRFVTEQSSPMMFQPSQFNAAEQREYYQNLANLIGLPLDTVRRYASRIDELTYVQEFLASERKIIGGMDSRYIGDISALRGERIEDPSYGDIGPAFFPAYMHYLYTDLDTKITPKRYEDFSLEANQNWNWVTYDSWGIPNLFQRLRRTLISNPSMKVFIGSGYYDLRTPFAAAEYSIDHLELPANYRDNFQIEYYNAGHGFIFDQASLIKFSKDLRKFYDTVDTDVSPDKAPEPDSSEELCNNAE
jgi:carboxypeptidase C (cathepsin A)